jgi:hypothetical protein
MKLKQLVSGFSGLRRDVFLQLGPGFAELWASRRLSPEVNDMIIDNLTISAVVVCVVIAATLLRLMAKPVG